MIAKRTQLGNILQRHGVISETQLQAALDHQRLHGGRMGDALIALGYCSDVEIARVLAEQVEIPFVDLRQTPPTAEALALAPAALAREHSVVPVRVEANRLLLAARNPFDIRIDEAFRRATRMSVIVAAAAESQLTDVLRRYESLKAATTPRAAPASTHGEAGSPGSQWSGERPEVVQMVDALIAEAVRRGAASLHVDPMRDGVQVRARLDGSLTPLRAFTGAAAASVTSRLHLMAGTGAAEGTGLRLGRCRVRVDGREVELRMSSLAGLTGESITCRIVDPLRSEPSLEALDLDPENLGRLREVLSRRHGLVLVASPLAGGKTTLLHALLREVAASGLQAAAVETDPETLLPGVHQLRVNHSPDQSLATAAEAALRQSPDVLMLEMLADAETAAVACRAAAGGRLVLAGVPAQGALDAMGRLLDMGVPPSLLAMSLAAVIAQRLVPRVCEACAGDHEPPAHALQALQLCNPGIPARMRRGRGCEECSGRGVRGRVGVHELLSVDPDLRYLIAERRPPSALLEHVARRGFRTMFVDTAAKTLRGLIPAEEALGPLPLVAA